MGRLLACGGVSSSYRYSVCEAPARKESAVPGFVLISRLLLLFFSRLLASFPAASAF